MQSYQTIKAQFETDFAQRMGMNVRDIPKEYRVMLDLQAWEMTSVYTAMEEHRRKQARAMQQHQQPAIFPRVKPAHAIAYSRPVDGNQLLSQDKAFSIEQSGGRKISRFTPVLATEIHPLQIQYVGRGEAMMEVKEVLSSGKEKFRFNQPLHPGELGLGINGPIDSLSGLRVFLDWQELSAEKQEVLKKRVPAIRLFCEGHPLETAMGFGEADGPKAPAVYDAEGMRLKMLEQQIVDHYAPHFIRILERTFIPESTTQQPPELKEQLDEKRWAEHFTEPLIWIRVLFPVGFGPEEIRATRFALNAFPVCNRWVPEGQDFVIDKTEFTKCLTRNEDGMFLGIQRLWSKEGRFTPALFTSFGQAAPGTYAIQESGVEKFSPRDAMASVLHLQHQMDQYREAFGLLERDKLHSALSQLERGLQSLEAAVAKIPENARQPNVYLHVKARCPREQVMLRYWLTEGEGCVAAESFTPMRQVKKDVVLENGQATLISETR
ncbi:MAG: hypothetical protein AAF206_28665 [Bacteroidota bacterium]